MGKLAGKVAVVTGASQGIGLGIAKIYAREGASVVISARRGETLEEVRQSIAAEGFPVIAVQADVAVRADADRTIAAAIEHFGKLDILVNNAQASIHVRIEDITDEAIALTMGSGYFGTLFHMQAALPHLKERGGSIINFGSSMGVTGEEKYGIYASTKEAIRALTRTACREWGQYQIRTNVMCPAAVTPIVEWWLKNDPNLANQINEARPLKRMGETEQDIAPIAVFLGSDDSRYVTGQTIFCNGGLTML